MSYRDTFRVFNAAKGNIRKFSTSNAKNNKGYVSNSNACTVYLGSFTLGFIGGSYICYKVMK